MTINKISKNFESGITPLEFTKEIYNILLLKLKVKNGLSSIIMNDVFQFGKNSGYELRSGNRLQRTNIQAVHFGSESIKTLGVKIWDLILAEIKASKSLMIFKKKIKNQTPKSCPCRFYRVYIGQAGFIN